MSEDERRRRRLIEEVQEPPFPEGFVLGPEHSEENLRFLNRKIENLPSGIDSARWLDRWSIPLLARKLRDLKRIIEALEVLDQYLTVSIGGSEPTQWTETYLRQTLQGLKEELECIENGRWSKVLQPLKNKRGNLATKLRRADLKIRQEAIYAIPFFEAVLGSRSKALNEIADVLRGLGLKASRATLLNWHENLSAENLCIGATRSRFFSELPEDMKRTDLLEPKQLEKLRSVFLSVLKAWVGDRETDAVAEKSAKDSGQ